MTFEISNAEKERISDLHGIRNDLISLRETISQSKISEDGKYLLFEDTLYYTETGEVVPLTEAWTLSDTLHTIGDVASAGMDFVIPGSGAIIDTLNGLSYIIEAQFKDDRGDRMGLYVMAAITFAFVLAPGPLQAAIVPLKRFVKTGKGAASPMVKKGVNLVYKSLNVVLAGLPSIIRRVLKGTGLGRRFVKKFGQENLDKLLKHVPKELKEALEHTLGITTKTAKGASRATVKGGVKAGLKTMSKISMQSMKKFFTNLPKIARGAYVLRKFGFNVGKEYAYTTLGKGNVRIVKILGGSGDNVVVQFFGKDGVKQGGRTAIGINNFLKGTVNNPWVYKGLREVAPLFIRSFARFILPDGSGLDYEAMAQVPDLDPDQTSMESLAYLREELDVQYQGDTGAYTVNNTVQAFQNALVLLGYPLPQAGADGKFGPETQTALKRFQADTHEEPTGKMNRSTAEVLAQELRRTSTPNSEELQQILINL